MPCASLCQWPSTDKQHSQGDPLLCLVFDQALLAWLAEEPGEQREMGFTIARPGLLSKSLSTGRHFLELRWTGL